MDKVHTLVGKLCKRKKLVRASDAIDEKIVLNERTTVNCFNEKDVTLFSGAVKVNNGINMDGIEKSMWMCHFGITVVLNEAASMDKRKDLKLWGNPFVLRSV